MNALNPVQRIGDQIAEPMIERQGVSKAAAATRAGELLELVGIPKARGKAYPHELSGGMRQRAMIAMALACDPAIDHRRRAHDGARRHGAGPDPGAPRGPAREAGPVAHPHHPRPVGARGDLRPGDDHVRGPGRRRGPGRDDLPDAAPPLHADAPCRLPRRDVGTARPGDHPRFAARPPHAASRLSLPPPVPCRHGRLSQRGAPRGDVRRPRPGCLSPLPAGQRRRAQGAATAPARTPDAPDSLVAATTGTHGAAAVTGEPT